MLWLWYLSFDHNHHSTVRIVNPLESCGRAFLADFLRGSNENCKTPNVIDPWPGLTFSMYTTVICEDDDLGKCGYFELFTNNNREMLSKQSRVAVLSVDWHAINSS